MTKIVLALVVGLILGAAIAAAGMVATMRKSMVVPEELPMTFEQAEEKLRAAVPAVQGWGFPIPELDFVETLRKKGKTLPNLTRGKIFFLCNPSHASQLVSEQPRFMGIMPCSWGLYETNDGKVYLTRMNMPLMAKVFSGTPGEVLGKVSRDEEKMHQVLLGH